MKNHQIWLYAQKTLICVVSVAAKSSSQKGFKEAISPKIYCTLVEAIFKVF